MCLLPDILSSSCDKQQERSSSPMKNRREEISIAQNCRHFQSGQVFARHLDYRIEISRYPRVLAGGRLAFASHSDPSDYTAKINPAVRLDRRPKIIEQLESAGLVWVQPNQARRREINCSIAL